MIISRPKEIVLGGASLKTPVFFPSISTVKTALPQTEYLSILHSLRSLNQNFLISAFDLSRSRNGDELAEKLLIAQKAGAVVLMDSGNYESFWKDEQATWQQSDFHNILSQYPCTFAFGFDEQSPPADMNDHVALVVDRWQKDQATGGNRVIVPIVHGDAVNLPYVCAQVVQKTNVPMIAVAERRLGEGILQRTQTVMALRTALDLTGRYVGLHLLGTGNPISIALYSWAGADSFDGLEWCQTVIDHDTGLLFHLSQSDFFQHQTVWGDGELSFQARTLAHNLTFYADWMQRLRVALHEGKIQNFCRFNIPPRIYGRCVETFGWEDEA